MTKAKRGSMRRESSISERVARSTRIRTRPALNWAAFSQKWGAFNALYGFENATAEEEQLMNMAQALDARGASAILTRCRAPIARLLERPPGDMRLPSVHPGFRRRTAEHASVVSDEKQPSAARVAHLAGIMYQIRCNLLHGDKDPASPRDRRLVSACCEILGELVPALEFALLNRERSRT